MIPPVGAIAAGGSVKVPRYVVVGGGSTAKIAYSNDGINWSSGGAFTSVGAFTAVAFSEALGMFCAVTSQGRIYTSLTGGPTGEWTLRTSVSGSISLGSVAWHPASAQWVVTASSTNKIFTSPDGITWTDSAYTVPSGTTPPKRLKVGPSGDLLGIWTPGNNLVKSSNGLTWTSMFTSTYSTYYDYAWNGSTIIAVGMFYFFAAAPGKRNSSDAGATWGPEENLSYGFSEAAMPYYIARSPTRWVVSQQHTATAWSTDAAGASGTWTQSIASVSIRDLMYATDAGVFIAVGVSDTGIATSPDGGTWTSRSSGSQFGVDTAYGIAAGKIAA